MNPNREGYAENYFRSAATPIARVQTKFVGVESMTRQDQAEACNINNIYKKTQLGQLSLMANKAPTFGDFSSVGSYDTMLESINEANEAFMALPSDIRKQYNNDPEQYYNEVVSGTIADLAAKEEEEAKAKAAAAEQVNLEKARALVAKHESSVDK